MALTQGLLLVVAVTGVILTLVAIWLAAFGDAGQRAGFVTIAVACAGLSASNLVIWLALSGRLSKPSR